MNLLANPILMALQKLIDDKVKVLVAYVFPVYFWVAKSPLPHMGFP